MKLFQINEDDLAELERSIPRLCEIVADRMGGAERAMLRRVQRVLTDVRWNYQPHREHEIVEGGEL